MGKQKITIRPKILELVNAYEGRISWEEYKEMREVHGLSQDEFCLILPLLDDDALAQQIQHTASHCTAAHIPGDITYEQILVNVLVPIATKRLVEFGREGKYLRTKIDHMRQTATAKEAIMDRWSAAARYIRDLLQGETSNN